MKEDGDIASDGLHSSKRLRLSIPRGRSRSLSDSAGASTSSFPANLPSVLATANVSEPSIEAEPALVSDLGHSLENTDDGSAPRNEENSSDIRQESSDAGNGLQDVPSEVPDAVTSQLRMQLEDGTSISVEPGAEVSAVASDDPVVPPHGHDDPSSSRGEETRDALQGGEVSGGGLSNHQEQEADLATVQEMEPEVRHSVSQPQDEALPHNVATNDQVVTLDLSREYGIKQASSERSRDEELIWYFAPMTGSAILHTEARDQLVETVVLSEDELEAGSVDPTLTASAFAEPVLTAEDFDAFAPEPHRIPQHVPRGSAAEAGTSNPEQLATQLDSEGTLCPICMEPWTSTGEHRICCLACGHLFGMFCIKRWLKQAARKQGKCPQCNKRARVEDVRTLFVSRVAVIDGETQEYMQEAGSLRNENEQLRKQVVDLREEVQHTRSLIKALAGDQHGAFSTFSSSVPRRLDQRGHHTSESRRHSIAQNVARAALHRAHGSVNHDHSNPQSGRLTRETPFMPIEHEWIFRAPNGRGSPPLPEDQQTLRQFDETTSLGTGAHSGMIGDLEQRREENSSLRSGPERPFLVERGWNIRPPNAWGSPPLPRDQQTSLRRFSLDLSLGTDPHARMIGDIEQRREENIAARPLRSFTSLNPGASQGIEQGFVLQGDNPLNGAKAFDMDAHSQLLLVSGKPPDSMTSSGLKKMSLMDFWVCECINLPPGTGAIRDIRIAPTGTSAPGRLALVASLGKKLSLFSLESNNVVITYTLPHPSWACAWDLCDPNRVFTGLQNGTLLTFDMRQTSSPLETFKGPSATPIHTLQYVRGGGLLSASSNSLLLWPDIDAQEKRPVCLYQPGGPSVCVSASYNTAVDVMVASFRPKPTLNLDGATSSTPSTYSQADVTSQSTESASVSVQVPTHFCYVRTSRPAAEGTSSTTSWEQQGAMVGHRSQTVLSRTAIVNEWTGAVAGQSCLLASGDEGSNSVWLWDVASPTAKQRLSPHPSPVLDVRTAHIANAGVDILGCISERKLQLYKRSSSTQ